MKKKLLSKLLVFAMTVSLFSGVSQPVMAEGTGGTTEGNVIISGTLYDADGTALANKKVTLRKRDAKDSSGYYETTTDAAGKYSQEVPKGVYQIVGYAYDTSVKEANPQNVCAVTQVATLDDGNEAQTAYDLWVPEPITVPNGEFDSAFTENDWTLNNITGAAANQRNADNRNPSYSGSGYFKVWKDSDFEFDVSQTLNNLEMGTYVVNLMVDVGAKQENDSFYLYAKDADGNILAQEEIPNTATNNYKTDRWEVVGLTVEIGNQPVTVGIYAKCTANTWANIDEFRMGKLPEKTEPVEYTKEQLKTLMDGVKDLKEADYTQYSFEPFAEAKANAQTVYDNADATSGEIATAYKTLEKVKDTLVLAKVIPAKGEGDPDIQNDVFWGDTDGHCIYSQGGGIFKFDNKYYWYGVKYEEAEKYSLEPEKGMLSATPSPKFLGVTCYSSTDLLNWKYEGLVVTRDEVSDRAEMNNKPVDWVGRLGVAKVGNTYALLVQHECEDADNSLDGNVDSDKYSKQVLVLTSDSPTGEFKWNQRINMHSYTNGTTNTGDQTVFTDDDGTSYLVYSYGSGRGKIFLSKIVAQDNGKIGLAPSHMIYNGAGREGNCMFKYNGKYYVCASDLYGWNASHAYYMVLDSLEDNYLENFTVEKNMKLMDGGNDDFCHVTQTGFFYTIKGSKQDTVLFCGDRWADFAGNGLGYNQWCPLTFDENGKPYFNSLSAWNLDAATGEWNAHASNNYVKNGSFDADRVGVKELTGWNNTVNAGNSPINNNANNNTDREAVTGRFALRLGDSVDFDCKVSQNITSTEAVDLPDGNYTLTAKMKNSGTFNELSMYVKSGNLTKKAIISEENASFTEITLADITVSGGSAEVGFIAKGKAKASAIIDDLTFVRSAAQSQDTGSIAVPITSDVEKDVIITAVSEDGIAYVYETKLHKGETAGTYTVRPVKAGTYTVTVSVNSSEIQGASQNVTVTAGQAATAQAVAVTNKGGNVTGKVVNDKGAGIEGVTVTLTKGEEVITAKTDKDGTFTVSDILAGEYAVQVEKEGYIAPASINVTVVISDTVTVPEQTMESAMGVVTGKVRDSFGQPVSNATVTLRGCQTKDNRRRYTVKTNAAGRYTVQAIEGTYQILASKEGVNVQAVSEKVTVERKQSYTVSLWIPEAITVPNGDFEKALNADTDWTNTGTAGKQTNRGADVLSGKGGYNVYSAKAFTIELHQTLTGLENGTYVVNVKADSGFVLDDELYVYAKNAEGTLLGKEDIPNISVNSKGEVIGLLAEVTDGTLTIGLTGDMSAASWSHVDDFCVGKVVKNEENPVAEVVALITAIGEVDTSEESKGKIDIAREEYDALTDEQKSLVTNYSVLQTAESKYTELKDQAAANEVIALITAIEKVEATDECKAKIEAAEKAYVDLTDAQKALVTNYKNLADARAKYDELTKGPSQEEKDKAAAQNVINLITAIGTVDNGEECGTKITKAEAAYTALTDAQKALVTNYKDLTDARAKYDELTSGLSQEEKNQRAANAVIKMINEIGEVEATDNCKAKIEAAENAYKELTDAQKALVTNYNDLRTKREAYDKLTKGPSQEEKDKAAAQKVIDLITAIGTVNDSEECGAKITKAEIEYTALTDAQKALVTNHKTLTDARAKYEELTSSLSQEEKDKRAANIVIKMIDEIGTVEATDGCKAKIEAAEKAYADLTDAQKKLVTNYNKLTDARAKYDELAGPTQEEKDQAAADEVINLINSIGTVDASAASKARIEAARAAFSKLTKEQQALVTNANILTAAEDTYKKLTDDAAATAKTDISKATVSAIPSQIYTGKAITPAVAVSYNGQALVSGKDYTLGYTNNTNIGTASITITGAGNYTGTLTKTFEITVSNGKSYTVGSYKYKITSAKVDGKGTVAVTGGTKKTMKSVKIAATVKIGGKSFQITSIDKNAFKGYSKLTSVTIGKNVKTIGNSAFEKCKKLKKIKISSTGLKKVGKNAIRGINKKATIQCPKKQLSKYKKLFKSSTGYKKTMKIKK